MGIRHTLVNLRDEFERMVMAPFAEAYAQGRTPNPCILCNRHIKFPYLLKLAGERGAGFIATGHYARVVHGATAKKDRGTAEPPSCRPVALMKGVDPRKDQSYVLYALRNEELERLLLPLGDIRKDDVRGIAKDRGLTAAADRPESQEICFVEEKKYFKLVGGLADMHEGPLIDVESGKVIGRHRGIYHYTIGQRKRLGVATGAPLYVVKIDPSGNAVYVGPKEKVMIKEFSVADINWLVDRDALSAMRNELTDKDKESLHPSRITHDASREFRATVKVRSTMRDEPAAVEVLAGNEARVVYDEPQWAPAPGQSAVFYSGDIVIGGGVISDYTIL